MPRAGFEPTITASKRWKSSKKYNDDVNTAWVYILVCLEDIHSFSEVDIKFDSFPEQRDIGDFFEWSCKPVLCNARLQIVVIRCQIKCY
jgi:hypothetical protein